MAQEITVTRGLVRLGTLEKQIDRLRTAFIPLGAKVKGKLVGGNFNGEVGDFSKFIKSAYQQLTDLISERDKIKTGIVISNANTLVMIGGESMTVATAIERKQSVSFKKSLAHHLQEALGQGTTYVEQENAKAQTRLDAFLEQNFSSESKPTPEDYANVADPFWKDNKIELVDPLKLAETIEALRLEIEVFEEDVDVVLSESNATTMIEV